MFNSLTFYFRLIRIKQWVKNTFIFFPLIFSGELFDSTAQYNVLVTFIGFCFVSSGLYILNDMIDLEKDRHHPKKSKRPLVQQNISKPLLFIKILTLIISGFYICSLANILAVYVLICYVMLGLLYNTVTKKVVLLDVISISLGFHFRIWAGAIAIEILPSIWLQLCVFLLALFLGFTKRRHELSTLKNAAPEHKSVLSHYTSYLLDQIIIICSTLTIVFYGLYTINSEITLRTGNNGMIYSTIFVLYGIFRYLYLVHVKRLGGDPGEILFSDLPLFINIILWIFYVGALLYF